MGVVMNNSLLRFTKECKYRFIETVSQSTLISPFMLEQYFNNPNKRITLLVSGQDFEDDLDLSIDFLNSGHKQLVLLKGIPGVYEEFYMDHHPKLIGCNPQELSQVGIKLPPSGIIDPSKEQIELASYKKALDCICEEKKTNALNIFNDCKFLSLGKAAKQKIAENFWIYANAHIFDLYVEDGEGRKRVVTTYKNTPIVSEEVKIIGIGPDTTDKWLSVLEASDLIIVAGNDEPYRCVLDQVDQEQLVIHI